MKHYELIVTGDGSHTIAVPELNETYHSIHGSIQESTHVFIQHGLEAWFDSSGMNSARIFEVGFGTGLNALLTISWAEKHQKSIEYEAIESSPIPADDALLLNFPQLLQHEKAKRWFEQIHQSGWDGFSPISHRFHLQKIHGSLQDYVSDSMFDICYYDAFAPSKQPEMWDISLIEKTYQRLNLNGIFITYCAAGHLKRSLKALGFMLEVLPGPPGKHEIVRAVKK